MRQFDGMPPFRTVLKTAGAVICLALCVRIGYYAMTDGFSLARVEAPLSFPGDFSVPPPSGSTLKILSSLSQQHFRYFKKGSQAYAFLSEDGQYVLKLFKLHHLQQANWLRALPAFGFLKTYRDFLIERRDYRIDLTLNSYKLAAEQLPDECALIYAQILPSPAYSLPVTIHDAVGRTYTIDLAQHGFAVQRRCDLVIPCFERWIRDHDMEKGRAAIDSLVALIARRSSKGIQDIDPDLHKNAGLLNGHAIFIDIGSFRACPEMRQTHEMKSTVKKVFLHFSEWLADRSFELNEHLAQRLETPGSVCWSSPSTPRFDDQEVSVVGQHP